MRQWSEEIRKAFLSLAPIVQTVENLSARGGSKKTKAQDCSTSLNFEANFGSGPTVKVNMYP